LFAVNTVLCADMMKDPDSSNPGEDLNSTYTHYSIYYQVFEVANINYFILLIIIDLLH